MKEEQIVQFVCFETPLDTEEFVAKWEQFAGSVNKGTDINLHQSRKNGLFRYVVLQRCMPDEFHFILENRRRSPFAKEVAIKAERAGGYSILQLNRTQKMKAGERKLFAFLHNPISDPDLYSKISVRNNLNIYEPYYENCRYACILEFFIKD